MEMGDKVRTFRARKNPEPSSLRCATLPSLITSALVSSLLNSFCCLGFGSRPFPGCFLP